jgi:hypothetical protein
MNAWWALQANPSPENIQAVKYWFGEAEIEDATLTIWYGDQTHIKLQIGNAHYSKTFGSMFCVNEYCVSKEHHLH